MHILMLGLMVGTIGFHGSVTPEKSSRDKTMRGDSFCVNQLRVRAATAQGSDHDILMQSSANPDFYECVDGKLVPASG